MGVPDRLLMRAGLVDLPGLGVAGVDVHERPPDVDERAAEPEGLYPALPGDRAATVAPAQGTAGEVTGQGADRAVPVPSPGWVPTGA